MLCGQVLSSSCSLDVIACKGNLIILLNLLWWVDPGWWLSPMQVLAHSSAAILERESKGQKWGKAWWETKKALVLCKHCWVTAQSLVYCQHCCSHCVWTTAPFRLLCRKFTSLQHSIHSVPESLQILLLHCSQSKWGMPVFKASEHLL